MLPERVQPELCWMESPPLRRLWWFDVLGVSESCGQVGLLPAILRDTVREGSPP
jgi:hypothetical protein